ncbi:MAG: UbiA family prenyltransferase [Desulfuromonadaceae bacterium]|nr:UbiA family prenyltransferase [Desulfuromonadaceae bacterium]
MLFFPPFLGGCLFLPGVWQRGLLPLGLFCLAASASYIFNDLIDCPSDRLHPLKSARPLPSGAVSPHLAVWWALLLAGIPLAVSYLFLPVLLIWLVLYLLLSVFYTLVLKKIVLLDVVTISALFLVRLEAGGAAFGVRVTIWLLLSVFLLAFFLSAGKRYSESLLLGEAACAHRGVLACYSPCLLLGLLWGSGISVLLTYSLYCFNHNRFIWTIPLCAYGLVRYSARVRRGADGDPTASLLKDRQLFIIGLSWVSLIAAELYFR